jgi:hypothetical protein
MNWGRTSKKALQSNDLRTEFSEWREIAADRNQWRAICGSKMPGATKETPTSSRQDIWAEVSIRHFTIMSTKTYTENPDEQNKMNKNKRKKYIKSNQPA